MTTPRASATISYRSTHQIGPLAEGAPTWRRGDDLDAFIAGVQRIPFRAGGHKLFSAHQMCTCRMGQDPQTSVAGPFGELHDTKGVWIGDASAFIEGHKRGGDYAPVRIGFRGSSQPLPLLIS